MAISKFVPLVLIALLLGLAVACGKAPAATPASTTKAAPTQAGGGAAPAATAAPTVKAAPTQGGGAAPAATAAPTSKAATPTGSGAMPGGFPFTEAKFKTGDWSKYRMMMGSTTQTTVEIEFGGTTYAGTESVVEFTGMPGMPAMPTMPAMPPGMPPGMPPIPGMPTGPTASLVLIEKGNPTGKSWMVTKTGAQVQCSRLGIPGQPTPVPSDLKEMIRPDMTLLGTDTYKVPETGQTVKVWKYRTKVTVEGQTFEQEMWVSNEVPSYSVKVVADNPITPGTKMTVMELLAFGSGAKVSITSAELAANCK